MCVIGRVFLIAGAVMMYIVLSLRLIAVRWNALDPNDEHSPLIVPREDLRRLEHDLEDCQSMMPSKQSDSEYLNFERIQIDGRSTPIVRVISKSNGMVLGRIAWFSRWRQFCFYPANQTIFNIGCMNDISCVIQGLHDERRKVRK